jgi:hypothetical protein
LVLLVIFPVGAKLWGFQGAYREKRRVLIRWIYCYVLWHLITVQNVRPGFQCTVLLIPNTVHCLLNHFGAFSYVSSSIHLTTKIWRLLILQAWNVDSFYRNTVSRLMLATNHNQSVVSKLGCAHQSGAHKNNGNAFNFNYCAPNLHSITVSSEQSKH